MAAKRAKAADARMKRKDYEGALRALQVGLRALPGSGSGEPIVTFGSG